MSQNKEEDFELNLAAKKAILMKRNPVGLKE